MKTTPKPTIVILVLLVVIKTLTHAENMITVSPSVLMNHSSVTDKNLINWLQFFQQTDRISTPMNLDILWTRGNDSFYGPALLSGNSVSMPSVGSGAILTMSISVYSYPATIHGSKNVAAISIKIEVCQTNTSDYSPPIAAQSFVLGYTIQEMPGRLFDIKGNEINARGQIIRSWQNIALDIVNGTSGRTISSGSSGGTVGGGGSGGGSSGASIGGIRNRTGEVAIGDLQFIGYE